MAAPPCAVSCASAGAPALDTIAIAAINAIGYQYLLQGRVDRAIEIFKKNVADYPGSWNTYDSLGEAYRGAGDLEQAKKLYTKALELVTDQAQKDRITGILNAMADQ